MEGPLGDPLLHLHPTGAAFGRAELDVVVLEAVEEASARAERSPEIGPGEAEGARHPRATPIDEVDLKLGDGPDQVEPGVADAEGPQVAGLVIADPGPQRVLGLGELAPGGQAGEVLPDVHRVLGDEAGVEVVGQPEIFAPEHQGGARFGADDRVAVADRVSQGSQVREGEASSMIEVTRHQRRHPGAFLAAGDVDVHAGLAEDPDDRLGQFLVEVIREDVDEVGHPRPGGLGPGLGQAELLGPPEERGPAGPGEGALSGRARSSSRSASGQDRSASVRSRRSGAG